MKKSFSLILGTFLVLVLSACGSKKEDPVQPGVGGGVNLTPLNIPRSPTVQPSETPVVNSNQNQFQIYMDAFLSPVLRPGVDYGKVSSQNGFFITGFIELDSAQNILTANSGIMFRVFDSFTQTNGTSGKVQPLTMGIPLKTQKVSSNPIQLIFEDQYSRLIVDATVNGAKMTGRVSFQTLYSPLPSWTPTENGQPVKQGVLGDFQVDTCSFFKCVP